MPEIEGSRENERKNKPETRARLGTCEAYRSWCCLRRLKLKMLYISLEGPPSFTNIDIPGSTSL